MRDQSIIKVDSVSKVFCKDLKRSLLYGIGDLFKSTGEREDLRKDEFWAVKDISFELKRGDFLGLIGHNGAGKSTLLKMLNGIIKPDKGSITIQGRVGALIELGAGFNPILTGRENIYNNGSVLGFSKRDIDQRLDEIIDFSEIEEYIDMPVQNYSSGMKVRLGFAVAANLEPDLLLIDEVLAVGDAGFRIKCINRISKMSEDTAIILVSHNMPQIARVCTEVLMMDAGQMVFKGNPGLAVEEYFKRFPQEAEGQHGEGVEIEQLEINGKDPKDPIEFRHLDNLTVRFQLKANVDSHGLIAYVVITDKELKSIALSISPRMDISEGHSYSVECVIPSLALSNGSYTVRMVFLEMDEEYRMTAKLAEFNNAFSLHVHGTINYTYASFQLPSNWSI